MLFEAYENLNFGRFHVLAALNLGTTHKKNFKVQLNSCVKSSCQSTYMQEDLGIITMQSTDL
jgi:hypothetical protein